eukprot:525709-Pelagomonas_calceolata.AAC.1
MLASTRWQPSNLMIYAVPPPTLCSISGSPDSQHLVLEASAWLCPWPASFGARWGEPVAAVQRSASRRGPRGSTRAGVLG